ncbi:outer membrane protein assembly factor BamB family protein [Crateriforma conspicua]|uniref:Outer membrane biogenesis protein BamB n=1 Tax=Crateriforma conspicua TaxID=2527996 RepID=A0A5C5Y810_9PLAN|nr:PQQ-binding-like beta-propeller repeat protein [Crateriforma conspicua]QDV65226.1 outer membrane biogenesis protein BamB [Crateriforma conspicua]TWT70621.1 outer membrane biogenesis protein BamB [Crateriforma conspicua]
MNLFQLFYRNRNGLSVVATWFLLFVGVALFFDFGGRIIDPYSDSTLQQLKLELREQPNDDSLKQQIRQRDQQVRQQYFRRKAFTWWGARLCLVGAVIVFLASRRLGPMSDPSQMQIRSGDPEPSDFHRKSTWGMSAVTVLVAACLMVAVLLQRNGQQDLSAALAASRAIEDSAVERNQADGGEAATAPPEIQSVMASVSAEEFASNWYRFRGPRGDGTSAMSSLDFRWDADTGEGILWKVPVECPGNGSPVVWGDRVFLASADETRRCVQSFSVTDGTLLWTKEVEHPDPTRPAVEVSEDTGYAASTMTTNGQLAFAIFADGLLVALDRDGNEVWLRDLGPLENIYGHASSLVLSGDRLIVQLDQGSKSDDASRIDVLDVATGDAVYSIAREVPASWSTPIVANRDGQDVLIACADPWVIAYNLSDGSERWRCAALRQDVGPSPVFSDQHVIVANESPGATAVRWGGTGDVTETHVDWTAEFSIPDTTSPLIVGDLVLMLTSYGTLAAYDADSGGDPLWETDYEDNFQASPTCFGDDVLLVGETGLCWTVRPSEDGCETITESNLGEDCVTSPAVANGKIFLRGREHLYCLGLQS